MELIAPGNSFDFSAGTAVALGNFDGLHIGHSTIINDVVKYAKDSGILSTVYTFQDHPAYSLGDGVELITPLEIKAELLSDIGIDCLCLDDFTVDFMKISPEDFVNAILKTKLNARYVSAGFNYRFGYRGQGDASMLQSLCDERGIACSIHGAVTIFGQTVSSSAIREFIGSGDMEGTRQYLGRYYFLKGTVAKGRSIGRLLGFPTANLKPPNDMAIPGNGVYLTFAEINGVKFPSLTNVGTAPTFGCMSKTIETHILNYRDDLYGKELKVHFLKRLRYERKFASPSELRLQIARDTEMALGYFKEKR